MEEDQDKYLDEHIQLVKQEAFFMKRALENFNLKDALRHSANMIGELRTSLLSPRYYFDLYMQVFDELRVLEQHFFEEQRKGRRMKDLYESVQHAGNILPRLYLLVTVGSVYIKTHEAPAKDILHDLIEMVKGVQHPTRGLFLRYYLSKMTKDKLPDLNSEYEGEGGDVNDAINFIVQNLSEMNRLWIRLQHTSSHGDKQKREAERNQLRVTVGENIVRLSNLEGVNLEVYQENVLPRLIEIIIKSNKDVMSQQYLMDCIIQAFPDEYHLNNLETLLETTTRLQANVDIKSIFINLMDRLAEYASSPDTEIEEEFNREFDIFGMFKNNIDKIMAEQGQSFELKKLLELQVAFLRFSLKCYPTNLKYVNTILESVVGLLEERENAGTQFDQDSLKQIEKLLSYPLETLSLAILPMTQYPKLLNYLPFIMRKRVSNRIIQGVVKSRKKLDSLEVVEQLFKFISPLLKEEKDYVEGEDYEFEDEQQSLASVCHLVYNEDCTEYFSMLKFMYKQFSKGGVRRIKFTYPSMLIAVIRFGRFFSVAEEKGDVTIQMIFKMYPEITSQLGPHYPELTLNLYLECILSMNEIDTEREYQETAYDLATEAFMLFQDELSDSETKFAAIRLIVATLCRLTVFDEDNIDTLTANAAQYSAKLLKKPDQALAVTSCSHMFDTESIQEGKRVLECLKKALKISNNCMASPKNLILFVHILNRYLFYYAKGISSIKSDEINLLIDLIKDHISSIENEGNGEMIESAKQYFELTKADVEYRKENSESEIDYSAIVFE
mmetsp:Transcript_54426/g.62365  ORF Transcript_54426/g.62365 Transcript_54426/m.62365 type:complete len:782 (+) Transcript_54426:65-2410(+)